MLTNRRTCPASSRKCLTIAGKRCSISPSNSGSVADLHSIDWTPSVNRRNAVGISTVIFITIFRFLTPKFGNTWLLRTYGSYDLWVGALAPTLLFATHTASAPEAPGSKGPFLAALIVGPALP